MDVNGHDYELSFQSKALFLNLQLPHYCHYLVTKKQNKPKRCSPVGSRPSLC